LVKYIIAETETFQKKIKAPECKALHEKISEYVYPVLRNNPFFGPNIKKLKGKYKEIYRFRLGDYRLLYKIEEQKVIVFIIDIEHRKDVYR
jgi:mRNA interferase RelE/StbE